MISQTDKNECNMPPENSCSISLDSTTEARSFFDKYDTDGSGLISFDEFRTMLPELGINISVPKMKKYFRFCDTDDSGAIDFEEFKVSLFLFDPQGNPVGFSPNALLSPRDAFEMFDKDQSGKLDEDEFHFLLQYLEIDLNEQAQDKMFKKYDRDKSGFVEYDEFQKVWARVGNTKKELADRNILIPKLATNAQLVKILETTIDEEEEKEKLALAEAERWRKWQAEIRVRKAFITQAKRRAEEELRKAMDAAGQVYVFGSGTLSQFSKSPKEDMSSNQFKLEGQPKLRKIWNRRIRDSPEIDYVFEESLSKKESIRLQKHTHQSTHRLEKTALEHTLLNKNVNENTVTLWGRRPKQIAVSESVMFCLCEAGHIYAWGGNDPWWNDLEESNHWHTHWKGNTTFRSKKLMCTEMLPLKEKNLKLEQQRTDIDNSKHKTLNQYYGCWCPPIVGEKNYNYMSKDVVPLISFERVKLSLEIRGKSCEGMTKLEMLDILYDDILFENKILGQEKHIEIRDLERDICDLRKKKKKVFAQKLFLQVTEIWSSLRAIQKDAKVQEIKMKMNEKIERRERKNRDYDMWMSYIKKNKSESETFTPRKGNIDIQLSGITERGGDAHCPTAYAKALYITAGANHASLIHQNGDLYMWGMGAAGRLGLDGDVGGNPRADVNHPSMVKKLKGKPIVRVSCGQSHSAAICSKGDLYVWGSCQTGKLGLGAMTEKQECYCSIPSKLEFSGINNITRVSCGASHTACIRSDGKLFVWGCGNGGRLGLGSQEMGIQLLPRLIESVIHETFVDISCGHYQTIAITSIHTHNIGDGLHAIDVLSGGRMYVAGPSNILGMTCYEFRQYQNLMTDEMNGNIESTVICQVSAGFLHQTAITTEGEILTWGNNVDGSCGQALRITFIKEPTKLLYFRRESNLALNKPVKLSSVYGNQSPSLAVDGNIDGGLKNLIHTQVDAQPFCEIDLETFALISKINIWNRTDEANSLEMMKDAYSKRLFPCWILVSQHPFPEEIGGDNLRKSIKIANARVRFTDNKRLSTFHLPKNIIGRYIRVQLESFGTLHLAQVEVFGTFDTSKPRVSVSYAASGKNVTGVVLKAVDDPLDIESTFLRAAAADYENATILSQFDTYMEVYKNYRQDYKKLKSNNRMDVCPLCTGNMLCEICLLKSKYRNEIASIEEENDHTMTLDEVCDFLLIVEKPPLEYEATGSKQSSARMVMQRLRQMSSKLNSNKRKMTK